MLMNSKNVDEKSECFILVTMKLNL